MNFLLADTFQSALAKLTNDEQKAVKLTVFDLQQDPSNPGLKFHRIDKSKDPNFWSLRVNRDIRLIVHKTKSSFLVAYVDHHDDAYKWAERRRIDAHPRTGAAQIVEVRERVEEITIPKYVEQTQSEPLKAAEAPTSFKRPLFDGLGPDQLLGVGVPEDWLQDIRQASEDKFLELTDHIPSEAAEALLDYVSSGQLVLPAVPEEPFDPFVHPDAQRRFRIMDNVEELEQALSYPWDKWAIYLHPAQKKLVEAAYSGPARVSGSDFPSTRIVAGSWVSTMFSMFPPMVSPRLASMLSNKITGDAVRKSEDNRFSFSSSEAAQAPAEGCAPVATMPTTDASLDLPLPGIAASNKCMGAACRVGRTSAVSSAERATARQTSPSNGMSRKSMSCTSRMRSRASFRERPVLIGPKSLSSKLAKRPVRGLMPGEAMSIPVATSKVGEVTIARTV